MAECGELSIGKSLTVFGYPRGEKVRLIFGSGHLRGIDKFLSVCWKFDKERGEANYDIDQDQLPQPGETLDFFKDKPKKVDAFQQELREKLLLGEFASDCEVYIYALENGFRPSTHAKSVVTELIKEGRIVCEGLPRMSKTCITEPRLIKLC